MIGFEHPLNHGAVVFGKAATSNHRCALDKNCRTFAPLCDDLGLARLIACFDSIPALIEIFRNFTPGTSPDRFFDMSCVDSKANPSGELCVRGSVDMLYSPVPLPLFGGGWGRSGRVGGGGERSSGGTMFPGVPVP